MKVLILGTGHVGRELAGRLRATGVTVAGTTTTPEKVAELEPLLDHIFVLRGDETAKVVEAGSDADAIVVSVAPNWRKTKTVEERHQHYREVLVESCASAVKACPRVLFMSSFSVYGDGGKGSDAITELTPTANHEEPSSRYYQEAERIVLANPAGCVMRFPDMYGAPGDMSFPQRVRAAHDYMAGKILFGPDAPLYAIHVEDVVLAVQHALTEQLSGIYNVCNNDNVPYTNREVFSAICRAEELPELEYLDQIKAPNRKISAARLYATGFRVQHPDPNAEVVEQFRG